MLLAPYISDTLRLSGTLSESGLQLAVSSWLSALVLSHLNQEAALSDQRWLFDSGLYAAVKDGTVES
jgi:hypothetical protein